MPPIIPVWHFSFHSALALNMTAKIFAPKMEQARTLALAMGQPLIIALGMGQVQTRALSMEQARIQALLMEQPQIIALAMGQAQTLALLTEQVRIRALLTEQALTLPLAARVLSRLWRWSAWWSALVLLRWFSDTRRFRDNRQEELQKMLKEAPDSVEVQPSLADELRSMILFWCFWALLAGKSQS